MNFTNQYLQEFVDVIQGLDRSAIDRVVTVLKNMRSRSGRLFILGVGGSAANSSHAVNDFRKIAAIEAYTPVDNVSELTARTNDEGWHSVFEAWLRVSRLTERDALLVFSVGGGNACTSPNLVEAIKFAKSRGTTIVGVVGEAGGCVAAFADACVIVPTVNTAHIMPHAESVQTVIWHLLISHPELAMKATE